MNKQTVLVTEPIDSSALKRLTDRYNVISSVNESNIKEINAVLTRKMAVSRDFISKAVNLKVIANHGSGADQIDLQAAKEYGVKVLSAPGLNALSVAELVLGFFINLSFVWVFLFKISVDKIGLLLNR